MDFPITHHTIKAYALARAEAHVVDVGQAIRRCLDLSPNYILTLLMNDIDSAVRTKSGATRFGVSLGSLASLTRLYHWDTILECLVDDCLSPLLREYFPSAVYEIVDCTNVYLVFNCPTISDQTNSPSQ